jgi:hypothetical protein
MYKLFDLSILKRFLLSTALPLALMSAGSVGAHAEVVVVHGANGASPGQPGESVTADAGHLTPNSDPTNSAAATGGNGAAGDFTNRNGGAGGAASAFATTTAEDASGNGSAAASAQGGLEARQLGRRAAAVAGPPIPPRPLLVSPRHPLLRRRRAVRARTQEQRRGKAAMPLRPPRGTASIKGWFPPPP